MRIQTVITLVLLTLTVGYGLFRAQVLLFGPTITLYSPQPYETVEQTLTVSGMVQHAVFLSVNDTPVLPDRNGLFHHALTLPPEHSIVEVHAKSRQNRATTIHIPITVTPHYAKESNKKESKESNNKEGN